MKTIFLALVFITANLVNTLCYAKTNSNHILLPNFWEKDFWSLVVEDHRNHYSILRLSQLGISLGLTGIIANTNLDESIKNYWQDDIRCDFTNDLEEAVEKFDRQKQIRLVIPIYLGVMILSSTPHNSETLSWLGKWGNHSIRALFLGAPQQAILTEILGGQRPNEGTSHWKFFNGDRSVSGHAFYGSLPLITAAKVTQNLPGKVFWYSASTLPSLSRVNGNKHYFSQALLGWLIALLSATSVNETNAKFYQSNVSLNLLPLKNGAYLGISLDF